MANLQFGSPVSFASDWRYAGDDWTGDNALTYIVYATAPVLACDGVTVVVPGVPQDLTGFTVAGLVRYGRRCAANGQSGSGPVLPVPAGSVLDAAGGVIALSLTRDQTVFPRQSADLWPAGADPDPRRALLFVRPCVVGPLGRVTVGVQPIFVF